ncbi:DNA replication complex subunit Gins51 [Methanobrevibacter sp.]
MDQFYQELRKIQKKERNNATLARVEEDFYIKIHQYIDELKKEAMRDPFSNVSGMLKQAQIIATEICERREKKISEAAVVNIHRSYHLFTGKPKFDLVDTTPLNLTPEEEKFYFSLIDTLKNHRNHISLDKLSDEEEKEDVKPIIKPKETQTNTLISNPVKESEDEVLDRLEEIKKAKPIAEEPRQSVEKQIAKSQDTSNVQKEVPEKPQNIEENPNVFDNQDEFYDFESKRVAKDTQLVTMLVFDDVGPIVGVDEKVYGPFRPQDLVTLPLVNAKIFFKNLKGRQVKI